MGIHAEQRAKDNVTRPLRDRVTLTFDVLKKVMDKLASILDLYQDQHVPQALYIRSSLSGNVRMR